MIYLNSGAMRLVLITGAALVVSACTTTSPTMSIPPETAGSKPMVMDKGMNCPCCASIKNESGKGGCCSDMKEGCSCCSGMTSGKGMMMCAPKPKNGMGEMDHSQMNHGATDIYAPAMKSMHENMSMAPTGNADVDFMRGMIPHHQGAIDMAKIVLEKGKDPEVRKLAQEVVAAQEEEISFMRGWLKKNNQ